jgi:SET domain-containing protein
VLLIPTYVRPSAFEGVGVFAAEDIPAGTLIWRLDPAFDRLIHKDEVERQPSCAQEFFERYAYPYPHDPDYLVVELDNGRFMNHCEEPNTRFDNPDAGFTRRAIAADEELVCNYAEFDPGFAMLPGRIYNGALVTTLQA